MQIDKLFETIKKDDVKTFSTLVEQDKGCLSLCFGRFPVLSLCYLYQSRKIVKKFERQLANIFTYTFVDQPVEAYKKFKNNAKKSLRLYVFEEQAVVTPLEMLAVTGDAGYLEQKYKSFSKSGKVKTNIAKIIKHKSGWSVNATDFAIKISKPLPKFQKLMAVLALAVAVLMIVLPVSALAYAGNNFGLGTISSPTKIANVDELEHAFETQDKYFALSQDIVLPDTWQQEKFESHLDGNGFTVTLAKNSTKGFATNLLGSVKNINFEIETQGQLVLGTNTAFVVHQNNGTMQNITVNMTANLKISDTTGADIYASAMVFENNGEILSSVANVQLSATGEGANAYLTAIASKNNAIVDNCQTTESSTLSTNTVDVAGIVSENFEKATISNCVNNAQISQTTASNNWLPNVGGVVQTNLGKVTDSFNNGKLSASTSGQGEGLELYLGGIACVNQGEIEMCKNNGDLVAVSNNVPLVVGGIASLNLGSTLSPIRNSGNFGNISATVVAETTNIFCGGIAGYNDKTGAVVNCFSYQTISVTGGVALIGEIIGVGIYNFGYNVEGNITYDSNNVNNFFVATTGMPYGVGAFVIDQFYPANEYLFDRCTAVASLAELKATTVYW